LFGQTYLNGAEDPENEGLYDRQDGSADAEHEIDADILANLGVTAGLGVSVGPVFEPNAPRYVPS
jgi:hypothetical protein